MTMAAVRVRLSVYRKPTILGRSIFGCVLLAWLFFIVPAILIAAGPEDPGGRYWLVPLAAGVVLAAWWLRAGKRAKR
jgi:hypothetical protein